MELLIVLGIIWGVAAVLIMFACLRVSGRCPRREDQTKQNEDTTATGKTKLGRKIK